eukprot:TRINITY_DN6455_c0_g1_i3.p2 TRINITY_DN6455_c0_g1~~TRINITY_DN6455_c0_g1_i3.p2  ORF type:complete len:500 (-),score=142.62 TRINITY_DN6455_c0_g1_i3:647-2146(-)
MASFVHAIAEQLKPKPKKNLRVLHWDKINVREAAATFWETVELKTYASELPLDAIDDLFEEKKEAKALKKLDSSEQDAKVAEQAPVFITDAKAIMAMNLMLGKLKISAEDLVELVMQLDDAILHPHHISQLLQYLPSSPEVVNQLKNYHGNAAILSNVDRVYMRLCSVDLIQDRLEIWIFKQNFQEEFHDSAEKLRSVQKSVDYLKNSQRLRDILSTILAVGNYLNQNHNKGKASGFRLRDTIPKLKLLKSYASVASSNADAGSMALDSLPDPLRPRNLIDFIVDHLRSEHPDSLQYVEDINEIVKFAVKAEQGALVSSVTKMYNEMKRIPPFLAHHKKLRDSRNRSFAMDMRSPARIARWDSLDDAYGMFSDFELEKSGHVKALYDQTMHAVNQVAELAGFFGEKEAPKAWEEFFALFVELGVLIQESITEHDKKLKKIEEQQKLLEHKKKQKLRSHSSEPVGELPRISRRSISETSKRRALSHKPHSAALDEQLSVN